MVAGYTRQALANIQPGLRANAEDCNAEWNQLATAFDNTAGHDHSGSVAGDGVKIPLGSAVTGVLPIANGGTGSATNTPATLQVNPGGLLVGAAGTVPGQGALTLNANTVAPPAPQPSFPPSLEIMGPDATNSVINVDAFGGSTVAPFLNGRHARGTGAAPTTVQSQDYLLALSGLGYQGGNYGGGATIAFMAAENWTSTAHGGQIEFITNPIGQVVGVASLILQGNNANFSGNVILAGNYLYMAGSGGQLGAPGGPFIYGDANSLVLKLGSGTTGFAVQNNAGTANPFTVAPNGLVATPYGYNTRAGTGGATTGNAFNLSWGASGPMHLWVDTVDTGSINVTPCDARLKKNLEAPTVDALAAINAVELKQFDWLANDLIPEHHEDIGFIAQQLAECVPNAVTIHDDPDQMLSVQLTPIVAHLIGAVQQLSAQNAALVERLAALEAKLGT